MPLSKQETQRQTILQFWRQGIRTAAKIHSLTKIPLRTIYRNLKKIKKTGDVKHRGGNGRISKITQKAAREIGQYIRRKPTITAKFIAAKLEDVGVNVSRSTVSSDETAFQLFRNTVRHWYKKQRPIRPIPKDRSKIFAWGGFCIRGKTSLFCFRGIMDGKFYTKILERQIPEVYSMLGDSWRLQQDNDPKHTSRVAKEFLKNNVPEVMDWPSNSPDLNPIENLWAIVKRNTELRRPKNLNELDVFLHEEWVKIPNNLLINLVNSMPQRCREVIDRNGERIPY
ncbi:IS630 family transposase [Rhizophagus irregularis DAOM 181602=DAOM 197198]|nr:IS630 family transposase [Rhizophagus irregularis DAOM 181602=DAOM 197198]